MSQIKETSCTPDNKDVKTLIEFMEKQYYTAGKYLQDLLKDKGIIKNARDFMSAQRNYVWNKCKASNLLITIFMGRSIQKITAYRGDYSSQYRKILDGQQRTTSLYLIVNNLIRLDMSKSPFKKILIQGQVVDVKKELHNKLFSELPVLWQDIIRGYPLDIEVLNNTTEQEAEMYFVMINEGAKSLSATEIQKALMGDKVRKTFYKYLNYDWVLHSIKVAAFEKMGLDYMSQFMTLLTNDFQGLELDKDTISEALYQYRENGISEFEESIFVDMTEYLNNVFTFLIDCKKETDKNSKKKKTDNYATFHYSWLNKVNTVMIMVAAVKAVQNEIPVTMFAKWAESFFSNPPKLYKDACGVNSTKKANEKSCVTDRLDCIESAINTLKLQCETIQSEAEKTIETDTEQSTDGVEQTEDTDNTIEQEQEKAS